MEDYRRPRRVRDRVDRKKTLTAIYYIFDRSLVLSDDVKRVLQPKDTYSNLIGTITDEDLFIKSSVDD